METLSKEGIFPFTLKVRNLTDTSQDVFILDCASLFKKHVVNDNISIESQTPNIHYDEILMHKVTTDISISSIIISACFQNSIGWLYDRNAGTIIEPFKVSYYDKNIIGSSWQGPLIDIDQLKADFDLREQQEKQKNSEYVSNVRTMYDIATMDYFLNFSLRKFTTIRIAGLPPKSQYLFYFYTDIDKFYQPFIPTIKVPFVNK